MQLGPLLLHAYEDRLAEDAYPKNLNEVLAAATGKTQPLVQRSTRMLFPFAPEEGALS